jgi:hypothetical protein
MRSLRRTITLAWVLGLSACTQQRMATIAPLPGQPFQADPPEVYVAKVKNLLVGLPPTDAEVQAVRADPTSLSGLVDGWMARPEYQAKMLTFFALAFQQTQISSIDFADMVPNKGLGSGPGIDLLMQNVRESFARTALSIVMSGRPITDAFTTKQLMMTPALMELYAFLDTRGVDDALKVVDGFKQTNANTKIYLGTAMGPIPISDSVDPTSPNYMHWYSPDVAGLMYGVPACDTDPIVLNADALSLHLLLYGEADVHKVGTVACNAQKDLSAASVQLAASDFTTWKLVTVRPPMGGETTTRFYDLPTLRTANELVVRVARPGFFSTPAFGANWSTNQSNQMRVTVNQALIVATGAAVDGTDTTVPPSTPGLDAQHAPANGPCYGCHQLLDPTRSILSATYSYGYFLQDDPMMSAQLGLFAFQGVVTPVGTIDDFAATLATHPLVPAAWAQKLCYYFNSAPCVASDPELQRVVGVFQGANLSWNALVKALVTSPLVTNVTETATSMQNGEVISVVRRDHLCAALDSRLGLADVCGLVTVTKNPTTTAQIVGGLPSDGYGRGATKPVLPNSPTLFYRAGLENICANVAAMVVDPKGTPAGKSWSSSDPDTAIADFVAIIMALTPSDPRSAPAQALLKSHFTSAMQTGVTATAALQSTFVAACLAPSAIGIGM